MELPKDSSYLMFIQVTGQDSDSRKRVGSIWNWKWSNELRRVIKYP
ncbi:hypothetical protein [Paenibacillus foliorum]|nr:hypothetical protein [Paenibacillus foliorum]